MGTIYADIRFARGNEENLPSLDEGKPALTKDTKRVFIGTDEGNLEIARIIDVNLVGNEVNAARGGLPSLEDRLDGLDNQLLGSVKKADLFINIKDYASLVVDGDWTNAIIEAEYDAYTLNSNARLYFPYGTYKITSKIMIRCELDASQATFEYYGIDTALVIGDDSTTGIVTARKTFLLPRVINKSRGTTGWDGTSIGVKCVNLNDCKVFVQFIQDFEKGLLVYGLSQGTAYSTFYLGTMWENHKQIVLDGNATGWVNSNTFISGRLQMGLTKGATVDDMNAV
jgi:hypothetical protein